MKQKKNNQLKILVVILIIILNLFSIAASDADIAPEPLPQGQPQTDIPPNSFAQNPTPENFDKLPDPTPEDLLKIQNPTIENFQKLDSNEQANYLSQKYDNNFAIDFYKKTDNVGKNLDLDNKYFSGDNIPTNSRKNIISNPDSSQKYFEQKYGKPYTFDKDIAQDFTFDATKNSLTNNGKILLLESLKTVDNIIKIQVVKEGYVFIKKEKEEETQISVKGDGKGIIEYSDQKIIFTNENDVKNELIPQGKTDIHFQQDGTITITGKTSGFINVNDEKITINNHRGTLTFSKNGDFKADNAEISASNYYFDGAGEKKGNEVQLWDHGDTTLDNIRSRNSLFIDSKTGVGITSQGQSGQSINDKKETVTIHLDTISDKSDYKPKEQINDLAKEDPAKKIEEQRQQAKSLRPSTGDLGKSAEVWIKKTDQQETIVTAKGLVDIGFYKNKIPLLSTPYYRGENGKSELDLKRNGETLVKIRGRSTYTDEQYGGLEITDQKDITFHGIRTQQDGASLSLTRNKVKDDDNIIAACFDCKEENAITIDKKITVASLSKNKRFYSETDSAEMHISLVQTTNGLHISTSTTELGQIAKLLGKENIPSIGRNLNIVAQTDEKNKEILTFSKPSGRGQGEITAVIETYKDDKKVNSNKIDFNIHKALGNEVIIIAKEDQSSVDKLLTALKNKKYDDLKDIYFNNNPKLRQLLLQQTKIDIDKIKDDTYISGIKKSASQFQEFNALRDKLRKEQGVEINENGQCISPPNCQAKISSSIQKSGSLAYSVTAARIKVLQAENSDPEAEKDQKNKNQKEIKSLQKVRQQMDKAVEIRKEQLKAKEEQIKAQAEQQKKYFEAGLAEQQAREDEFYRQEAIKKGIDPKDPASQTAIAHTIFLGQAKKDAIKNFNTINNKIESLNVEITTTNPTVDAYEECEGSRSASCTLNARKKVEEIIRSKKAELRNLETQKAITLSYVEEADQQGQMLASLHTYRPDFAAKLAIQAGNPALARQYSAILTAQVKKDQSVEPGLYSMTDQDNLIILDRANAITSSSYIAEGNLVEASQARNAITDPQIKKETDAELIDYVQKQMQEQLKETEKLADKKREEVLDDGFFKKLDLAGRIGGGLTTKLITLPTTEVRWSDKSYAQAVQDTEIKSLDQLDREAITKRIGIAALEEAKIKGMTVDEAMKLARHYMTSITNKKGETIYFSGTTAQFQALEQQLAGQQINKETQASIELEKAKQTMTFHDGKRFVVKADLERIAQQYPDTPAGKEAKSNLVELKKQYGIAGLSGETLEQYGDIAIQLVSIENVVPVGAITTSLTSTAKSFAVARGSALLTKEISFGTKIGGTLTKGSEAVGKFFGTEASLYREGVQTAKLDLQVAQDARTILGETTTTINDVATAERRLADAEKAAQGYQISKATSTNIFTRDIGLTSTERAAQAELRTASKEYQTAAKISQTSEETVTAADRVIIASQKVEEVSLSSRYEQGIINAFGTNEVKIARDIKPLQQAGVLVKVETAANGERTVFYDTKALSPAQQKAIQPQIDTVHQQITSHLNQNDLQQIVEGSDKIKINLDQVLTSPQRAANDVIADLQTQHTLGESDGAVPLVTERAATKAALDPVPLQSHDLTPSQVRILETTPSQPAITETSFSNFGDEVSSSLELEGDEMAKLATTTDVGLPSYARYSDNAINAIKDGETVQVATLDINRFKDVNTQFGHAGGDIFLEEFGQSLEQALKAKGVDVYYKGGKTFKLVCRECTDDLSVILSSELNNIRKTTIERSLPRISKLEGKPVTFPEEQFNVYAGVSQRAQLPPGSSIRESETMANQLNKQSLEAGKYGQLNLCGKDQHCSQIVHAGEITPELTAAGVKGVDMNIESLLKHGPPEVVNEYSFFEENIRFKNIDALLDQRKAALTAGDVAKTREIDFELLNNLARDQNGFIRGNDNFKATINYLLTQSAEGKAIDARSLVVVGGDEIGYVISRNGEVSVARIDLNFFGKVNQQFGVPKADEIKALSLRTISEVLEDARVGKIVDIDEAIAREIVTRFNNHMREQGIVIAADIEGQAVKVRPSLTIGVAQSNQEVAKLTLSAEKNGASVLNKVADAASEEQKIAGKRTLLLLPDEIKEIHPDNFVHIGTIKPEDIASIGKLETKPTDQLVAEFVLTDGKATSLDVLKNKPPQNLNELVDESITGSSQLKVERQVGEIVGEAPKPTTVELIDEGRVGQTITLQNGENAILKSFVGKGSAGTVYCLDEPCTRIIKFMRAPNSETAIKMVETDIVNVPLFEQAGIPVPKIIETGPDYVIKEFISGQSGDKILLQQGSYTAEQIDDLASIAKKTAQNNIKIDLSNGGNFVWHVDETGKGKFIVVDTEGWEIESLSYWEGVFRNRNPPTYDYQGYRQFLSKIYDSPPPAETIDDLLKEIYYLPQQHEIDVAKRVLGPDFMTAYNTKKTAESQLELFIQTRLALEDLRTPLELIDIKKIDEPFKKIINELEILDAAGSVKPEFAKKSIFQIAEENPTKIATDTLPLHNPQTSEQFKQRYELIGMEADYRESGQTIEQFLQNPNRETFGYELDHLVREQETGKLFFVTDKGVRENQLASKMANFLLTKNEEIGTRIHIPEMRRANFGDGDVVLVEYAEKTTGLDKAEELIPLIDPETGSFTSSFRTWIGDWDNKAGNLLVQEINGKKILVPIDFEMAFGANDGASIITNGKKLTATEREQKILALMAEKDPFLNTLTTEEYQHSISIIQQLTEQDYAKIKQMALDARYTEQEAETIINTLRTRAKTLEEDISGIITRKQNSISIPAKKQTVN